MVSLRSKTIADLAKIEGFGEVKSKKYGADINSVIPGTPYLIISSSNFIEFVTFD